MLSYYHLKSFATLATALFLLVGSFASALPDYDPVAEIPFFEWCERHPNPVPCDEPVGVTMSCNGIFFCCPGFGSEIRKIVCDGERFEKVPSTKDIVSMAVAFEATPLPEDSAFSVGRPSKWIIAAFATVLYHVF